MGVLLTHISGIKSILIKIGSVLTIFPTNCMFLGHPKFFKRTILSSFMKLDKKEKLDKNEKASKTKSTQKEPYSVLGRLRMRTSQSGSGNSHKFTESSISVGIYVC